MKKLLLFAIAIALVIWVVSWFRVPEAVATSGAQPWPGGMGTLESVAKRYPAMQANDASVKLTALAGALPKEQAAEPLVEYVAREIARNEVMIGKPPALPDVAAIRELLLREPIVWERESGVLEVGDPKTSSRRGMQMTAARALVANALAKARENDAAAWEDLHAAWNLARSLDAQPPMMAQTAALSIGRMINAVAWKMPLPAPAWLAELQASDRVRPLLESFQYQTVSYWRDGTVFPTKWLADSVEHDRRVAAALFTAKECDVTATINKHGSDLTPIWTRAFRYRAEREATANALRIREGNPIAPRSQCADGTWTYDGTTLRFSKDIAPDPQDRAMPLVLKVGRG